MALSEIACRTCNLDILSFTISHMRVPEHIMEAGVFSDILELAAIEYLEGRATSIIGGPYHGKILRLQLDLAAQPKHAWTTWLEDCEEGAFLSPQIQWRLDDNGCRGAVHDAITSRISTIMTQINRDYPSFAAANLEIRADISAITSHQKMVMIKTRAQALA